MKSKYQAFVFDRDGTIVSTREDIAKAVNVSLEYHHLPTHSLPERTTFIGNGSVKLIQRAIGMEHQDRFQSVFDVYYDYYSKHYKDLTHPYDGRIESLKYAKEKGVLLFIYTNKPQDIALDVRQTFFGTLFTKRVGIPLGGVTKPDPKAFLDQTKEYGLDYSKVAYFGDSVTDLQTAYNLKIQNRYSVLWGYQSKETLLSYPIQPKAFLSSPLQIKDVVDNRI